MKKRTVKLLFSLCCLTIGLWQCQQAPQYEKGSPEHIRNVTDKIDDAALANADANQENWLTYGGNYQEEHYSELNQINKETVKNLGLAWALEVGTKRGIEAMPLVVDGIMYATGPWSVVYAIDARKGTLIWEYDPKVPKETATKLCCGVVNRGAALYKGTVIFGTLDGRLISLNAVDGSVNWETLTIPEGSKYSITGAPRIANGKVLIGNGGAEMDARGYVTAYDAMTGKQVWRFYTVPGDPTQPFEHSDLEAAAKTWTGEWWKQGGGGTVWDAIVYDPKLNTIYIGVGNGTHWDRQIRSPEGGDNLYLSSIVALDADNGAYKWHFQTTPGDSWDYTATQPLILADLEIDGNMRQVIMQAPKNGFFYVLDRLTGEFISGKAYSYTSWATGLNENGRPIETADARYTDGKVHWITPGSNGAHSYHPMSYNRKTGLVYIPTLREAGGFYHNPNIGFGSDKGLGGGLGANISMASKLYIPPVFDPNPNAPLPGTQSGRLIAWDPVQQKEVWGVDQVLSHNGGILSTATGLVFQGDGEGKFSARDASTGAVLWDFDIRAGSIAAPITYMVDGEQYITIPVGWGGFRGQAYKAFDRIHPGTFYTFKLGGKATPPKKLPPLAANFTTLKTDAPPENIGYGFDLFARYCIGCHLTTGQGGGAIPDLTRSSNGIFNNYEEIILNGLLASEGMPNFGAYLSKEDIADIKSFVLFTADALSSGMNPVEYQTNLAKMQYLGDTKGPQRKSIE